MNTALRVLRWVVAAVGVALAIRLVGWVVGGADSGWPPDEPYAGLRSVLLVAAAALPFTLAVAAIGFLVVEPEDTSRRTRRAIRLVGLASLGLALLLANHLIGLGQLAGMP